MSGPEFERRALSAAPGVLVDQEHPVFNEPWEAQAFAMVLALEERGVFSRSEWSAALGSEIVRAQQTGDPDTGDTYFLHWVAALEMLVAEKDLASRGTLMSYHDA